VLARVGADDRPDVLVERRQFPRVPCGDEVFDRAIQVQALVGPPAPSPAQLVVAAAAELAGLVLLHHDDAFERIAMATGQPLERAVP
jgi:predicted nucleic acid-binding protein